MNVKILRRYRLCRALAGLWIAASLLQQHAWPFQQPPTATMREAARLNNSGTALMGQQQFEAASIKFHTAYQLAPSMVSARLNEGLAYFYLQRPSDAERAFRQVTAEAPNDPHGWYSLGLLLHSQDQAAPAMTAFERVLALDPADSDTLYEAGLLHMEGGDLAGAVSFYERALVKEPLHASANFGLARALQRQGKNDEAKAALGRFQHILAAKLGFPMSHHYGEEGKYGRVEDAWAGATAPDPMIPVVFRQETVPHSGRTLAQAGGACLIDLGDKSRPGLVVVGAGDEALQLYRSTAAGSFEAIAAGQSGLHAAGRGVACAAGDYDNDGLSDLAVAFTDRVLLFHNLGAGRFEDVTQSSGIASKEGMTSLLFVDFDHDGDLDLFATGSGLNGAAPNTLWRNNGNKTFTEWTKQTALSGSGQTTAATLSDLNNDRAVDILVAGTGGAPTFFVNHREGAFGSVPLFAEQMAPTVAVTTLDFNKDGFMDVLLTHSGTPGVSLWRNVDGQRFERVALPLAGVAAARSAVALDFDNDGWIDLALLVETANGPEVRMLRNLGPTGFADVSHALQLDQLRLRNPLALLAADTDGDGAADLVVPTASGEVNVLRNVGGRRHNSLTIRLKGLADNRPGVGTKVEIFANGLWQKWEENGQPEIIAGLGDADKADLLRLLWPTGVPQDEVDLLANRSQVVAELDRRGSSCPTLFAWDGNGYRFIADVIGAAVVGHWVSPSERNVPDPDEWIKVSGDAIRARNGFYSLRFGEPMEEVNFVDQVRLVAIDHPEETRVDPQEGFLSEPPFAAEKVIASRSAHELRGVWDDHGTDVRELVARRDQIYLKDFTNTSFAGFANHHALTLDLGPWIEGRPLRLLLHGFTEYFSASSMYSAWQAGLHPEAPSLDARFADGTWHRIVEDMGFPAGLPRTVVVDLTGKLPAGVTMLRIHTNLQIYWDQILVENELETSVPVRKTELVLASAELGFRGYPEQSDGATAGDLSYDYQRASRSGPFIPHRGAYTRYGDVTPLLRAVDDQFVIFGTGEDLDLEFSGGALPHLPAGWTRDFFFYANGFVKDMDFYEAAPFVVGEIPFHGMSSYPYPANEHYPDDTAHDAYQLEWNTRFEPGVAAERYQLEYEPRIALPLIPETRKIGGAP